MPPRPRRLTSAPGAAFSIAHDAKKQKEKKRQGKHESVPLLHLLNLLSLSGCALLFFACAGARGRPGSSRKLSLGIVLSEGGTMWMPRSAGRRKSQIDGRRSSSCCSRGYVICIFLQQPERSYSMRFGAEVRVSLLRAGMQDAGVICRGAECGKIFWVNGPWEMNLLVLCRNKTESIVCYGCISCKVNVDRAIWRRQFSSGIFIHSQ